MTEFNSTQLRNLALVGHGKSGKTSIAENCLFKCGATNRVGKTDDGTSILDYEPEEVKRKMTIDSSLASCEWQGYKINFIDTPGYPDFTGEVKSALTACESAIVVVSATSGIEVETDRAWKYAEELSLPRAIFINKMDREHADFYKVVEELRAHFGKGIVPIQIPIGSEASFQGVADLITMNTKVLIKNKDLIYELKYDFAIKLDSDFKNQINKNSKDFFIEIFSKPNIKYEFYTILKNEIVKNISKSITKDFFINSKIDAKNLDNLDNLISNQYIFKNEKDSSIINSVQQSVPAWLIFSMFFILIPISNTFINEKNFGTIQRIKSINIPLYTLLLGKILPYFIINQIQLIFMILIGIYIVPLFGGDSLKIEGSYFLIILISFTISFAAISFALLIANISKTTEEATSIGGVINIIFAAIAGIMVPKFVMPQFMQDLSLFSPMSWGLESFIEILVNNGSFSDIKSYLLYLVIFGTMCLIFANFILNKGKN